MTGLIIDSFAGGGGASTGIEAALGRPVDIAINHDPEAIAMHAANHPDTLHMVSDVWAVNMAEACRGRRVDVLWASPDCKHFSKAKGGRPVSARVRGLADVVTKWARAVRPRVIFLENVEEFKEWGPLLRNGKPCPRRKGQIFSFWKAKLERLGYRLDFWELRACDFGDPTIRKRLVLVARCDGLPIVKPAPTHGAPDDPDVIAGRKRPWRTAADIIDWSIPCPSIFERSRPLKPATMARIARGVQRYVIEAAEPFIVPITHKGDLRVHPIGEPLRTITTASRGELALVSPTLIQTGYGERPGQAPRVPGLDKPLGTVVAGGCKHALVAAFLAQHNTGMTGHDARKPLSTITSRGTQQQVVTADLVSSHLVQLRGSCRDGKPVTAPLPTVTAGGTHIGEVRAFLLKYYGTAVGQDLFEPLHSVTTKGRFGLVMVHGEPYHIADIGMRMLQPRELFNAQGFPPDYIIDQGPGGRRLTKTAQIRMCGNSVCRRMAEALVRANCANLIATTAEENVA